MSIASAIQTKQQQVAAAYTAASGKGATMPATENLTNLATCIGSIPAGGGLPSGFDFYIVDSSQYRMNHTGPTDPASLGISYLAVTMYTPSDLGSAMLFDSNGNVVNPSSTFVSSLVKPSANIPGKYEVTFLMPQTNDVFGFMLSLQ